MEETQDSPELIHEHNEPEETVHLADSTLPDESTLPKHRLIGFMKGQFIIPHDIKTMFAEEIEEMFYGPEALNKFDRVAKEADERRRQEQEAKS